MTLISEVKHFAADSRNPQDPRLLAERHSTGVIS